MVFIFMQELLMLFQTFRYKYILNCYQESMCCYYLSSIFLIFNFNTRVSQCSLTLMHDLSCSLHGQKPLLCDVFSVQSSLMSQKNDRWRCFLRRFSIASQLHTISIFNGCYPNFAKHIEKPTTRKKQTFQQKLTYAFISSLNLLVEETLTAELGNLIRTTQLRLLYSSKTEFLKTTQLFKEDYIIIFS